MKNKIITATVSTMILASVAMPAFAQTTIASSTIMRGRHLGTTTSRMMNRGMASTTKAENQQQHLQNMQNQGGKMISQRISSLNALIARIQGLKNVSASDKDSLVATLQGIVTDMNNVQSKISSDSSTTTMRSDYQSITTDYRVYALVEPQANILAAADRIDTIVAMMNTVGTKVQTRLSQATSLSNSSALQADLSDYNAKVSDASTQAAAAVSGVSSLVPDKGDKTIAASNTAALKAARTKIQVATKDLQTARKDVQDIIKALEQSDKSLMASTTTSQ